jgi:prolipoprotein diacylglyceryltransferase
MTEQPGSVSGGPPLSVAFLPSPARAVWYLGPLPVRGAALCVVAGIVLAIWWADRRYRGVGGAPGTVLRLSLAAVPAGFVGARMYSLAIGYGAYFGPGHGAFGIARIWDGGLGLPGGIAAGALAVWLAARRAGLRLAPLAGALAPALPAGLAVADWGDWFTQQVYGQPSALPWAVEITPARRFPGYENYATFQPTFLYQSLWDAAVAAGLVWGIRRFMLSGDRALVIALAVEVPARYATDVLRIGRPSWALAPQVEALAVLLGVLSAAGYLYLTRFRRGPDQVRPQRAVAPPGGGLGGRGPWRRRLVRGWPGRAAGAGGPRGEPLGPAEESLGPAGEPLGRDESAGGGESPGGAGDPVTSGETGGPSGPVTGFLGVS